MRKIYSNLLAISMMIFFSTAFADKGAVVFEKGDYYIIDTGISFTVAEWFSGSPLSKGNKVVGDLTSYGFKDIYNTSTGRETHIWIEDYLLDMDEALEKVYECVN